MKPTFDEEQELFRRLAVGDIEVGELVETYLYLVPSNVSRYTYDTDDLYQEGSLALYRAVEGFDAARKLRFCTYAAYWIRQAVLSYMYENASTIRIPVYMRKLMSRIQRGLDPGVGVSRAAVETADFLINQSTNVITNLNDPVGQEAGADINELTPILRIALNKLPERERKLVKQRYFQGRTLASIGREEGVSVERVRQIIKRALPKLKSPELESLLDDYPE